jgi:hypothetical protein
MLGLSPTRLAPFVSAHPKSFLIWFSAAPPDRHTDAAHHCAESTSCGSAVARSEHLFHHVAASFSRCGIAALSFLQAATAIAFVLLTRRNRIHLR